MKQFGKKKSFGKKIFSKGKPFRKTEGRSSARPEGKTFARSSEDRPNRFDSSGSDTRPPRHDDGERPELFKVPCGNCGKEAIVPFKPTGKRPILCKACFSQKEPFESRPGRFEQRGRPNDRFESRSQPSASPSSDVLDQINRKLDRIIRALELD